MWPTFTAERIEEEIEDSRLDSLSDYIVWARKVLADEGASKGLLNLIRMRDSKSDLAGEHHKKKGNIDFENERYLDAISAYHEVRLPILPASTGLFCLMELTRFRSYVVLKTMS